MALLRAEKVAPCGCHGVEMCKAHTDEWWARHREALARHQADNAKQKSPNQDLA
jgi:hypothetical protein